MRAVLNELQIEGSELVLDTLGIQAWLLAEIVHSGSERKSNFEEGTFVAEG
jgi:hypothetical protein